MSEEQLASIRAAYLAGKLAAQFDGDRVARAPADSARKEQKTKRRLTEGAADDWHH